MVRPVHRIPPGNCEDRREIVGVGGRLAIVTWADEGNDGG